MDSILIDGTNYRLLKLGTPVYASVFNKKVMHSTAFVIDDLTIVGIPLDSSDELNKYKFDYLAWTTLSATKQIMSPDTLRDVVNYTKTLNGDVLAPAPPNNRKMITLADNSTVYIPAMPEIAANPKRGRQPGGKGNVKKAAKTGPFVLTTDMMGADGHTRLIGRSPVMKSNLPEKCGEWSEAIPDDCSDFESEHIIEDPHPPITTSKTNNVFISFTQIVAQMDGDGVVQSLARHARELLATL